MKRPKPPVEWIAISRTEPDGQVVTGAYSLDKTDFMTVRMDGGGQKSARGGLAAASVAVIILGELNREKNARLAR